MGLFGFLKKEQCVYCQGSCSSLSRTKLTDGAFICKDCVQARCSFFVPVKRFNKDQLDEHIAYMDAQDHLYRTEFLTSTDREIHKSRESSIEFADSIGMFEVVVPNSKYHAKRELFRYDQVIDYPAFLNTHTKDSDSDLVKYDDIGLDVTLRCVNPLIVPGLHMGVEGKTHPYVPVLHIVTHKKVPDDDRGGVYESIMQDIRTAFADRYGVENPDGAHRIFQKTGARKHEAEAVKNISAGVGGLLGALKSGKSLTESAEEVSQTLGAITDFTQRNMHKWGVAADAAEQRAWGNANGRPNQP